jgi:hypothetical protein
MVTLTIRQENCVGNARQIHGFKYLWLMYLTGFRPDRHCLACFEGLRSRRIHPWMPLGQRIILNEAHEKYLYLCGVSDEGWASNLHIAMTPRAGSSIIEATYNGLRVEISGAVKLDIPPLPDGFRGLPREFTTCRNYQFGVASLEKALFDVN